MTWRSGHEVRTYLPMARLGREEGIDQIQRVVMARQFLEGFAWPHGSSSAWG
jgi:hypothetical protein